MTDKIIGNKSYHGKFLKFQDKGKLIQTFRQGKKNCKGERIKLDLDILRF